jgi:hypothetical protein
MRLTRSSMPWCPAAARFRANSSSVDGVVSTRPARRTRPLSAIATSQKSRCTSSAMKRITPPLIQRTRRRGGQNDNYGSVFAAHPGSRRGGQLQTTGSQPIVSATACPISSLPQSPCPGTASDANPTSGRNGSIERSFMPLQQPQATPRSRADTTSRPRRHLRLLTSDPPEPFRRRDRLGGLIHEYARAA